MTASGLTEFQIVLKDPNGVFLAVLDNYSSLDYSRVTNGIGALAIILPDMEWPSQTSNTWDKIKIDGRVEVWRSVQGGPLYLDGATVYFIRRRRRFLGSDGTRQMAIYAVDANSLIGRAYALMPAGDTTTSQTSAADDMCKYIFTNHVTTPSGGRRAWASLITVQADNTLAPSVTKGFSYRNALTVMQEIAQASALAGAYLAFDIVCTGQAMEFRTFIGQRGTDRRNLSGNAIIISPETGNLSSAEVDDDHMSEATYSFVGGLGQEANRATNNATDAARAGISPFGLIDTFYPSGDSDATALLNLAQAQLRAKRPIKTMAGSLIQTDGMRYGLHYFFGDYLTFSFAGETTDARLDGLHINVSGGAETIEAILRSEA